MSKQINKQTSIAGFDTFQFFAFSFSLFWRFYGSIKLYNNIETFEFIQQRTTSPSLLTTKSFLPISKTLLLLKSYLVTCLFFFLFFLMVFQSLVEDFCWFQQLWSISSILINFCNSLIKYQTKYFFFCWCKYSIRIKKMRVKPCFNLSLVITLGN